jgi:multiple sugar transport system permease protein
VLLTPHLAYFGLFVFYPVVRAVWYSFMRVGLRRAQWLGIANYTHLLEDEIFAKALKVTTIYTLTYVPIGLILAVILAGLIYQLSPRLQTFFKSGLYLPGVVSSVAVGMIWVWMYHPNNGLLNYMLSRVGLGPYQWLQSPTMALPSVIFMSVFMSFGSPVVLLTASMGAIPTTLYEVAEMDGAGKIRQFWSITLPLLKPTLLYLLVVRTIGSYQVFESVYVMTRGGPYYATSTLVYSIYTTAFLDLQFGYASAKAIVLFFIVVTLSIIQFKFLSTDVEY